MMPPGDAQAAAAKALYDGRPLKAVETLRASVMAMTSRPAGAESNLLQYQAFVSGGRDPLPPIAGAAEGGQLDPARVAALHDAPVRDAVTEIVSRARDTRIVILNEAHDTPRHRAFALELSRALRPLGFSLLAIEALSTATDPARVEADMQALARRGHPNRSTGFYIQEPVFGDFVRQALALGYQPVAYEETGPGNGIEAREETQARNLAAGIRAAGPAARMLVYVGYSHVAERAIARPKGAMVEWMAARLKRMTGIDPLTVSQTDFSETSASNLERAYHALVAPRLGRRPAVLLSKDGPLTFGRWRDLVDLHVVHPRQRLIRGRPDWYRALGRVARVIPFALRPKQGKRLVQAYLADEPEGAVPIDQVVVEAKRPLPVLMLPPGRRIRYAFEDPPAAMPPGWAGARPGG